MYGIENEFVSLETLGGGGGGMSAAVQLFNLEFQRALENCMDPNTKPTAKREVTLKVTIKPDETREACAVSISATCKLAAVNPYPTQIFLGMEDGRAVAVEHDPKQLNVFRQIEERKAQIAKAENVIEMERTVGND